MSENEQLTLCIDLGKTRCRIAVLAPDRTVAAASGPGIPGAASAGGAAQISERVLALVAELALPSRAVPTAAGVGVAGTLTDPAAGRIVAGSLAVALRLPVAVTSDIVTAHVGALSGGAGVALVAGTGAVALGLTEDGGLTRVDGWGPHLGDLGSGSWLGRAGIRAVLLAETRLGAPTGLSADLPAVLAPETDAARWVTASENVGERLARFAPAVLRRAEEGDTVSRDIAERAMAHLADTAAAAAVSPEGGDAVTSPTASPRRVSVLGGLIQHDWFAAGLDVRLRARGLIPTSAAGTALDGARTIALHPDLPHERYIHRAQ